MKIRDFWTGFGLAVITLGLYEIWWYYYLNDELRSIGRMTNDHELRSSRPALSTAAVGLAVLVGYRVSRSPAVVAIGVVVLLAAFISQYRFGKRLRRAQELVRIPDRERFRPLSVFLLFPGNFLVVPPFFWYAYVTEHQNVAIRAAEGAQSGVALPA